MNKTPKIFLVVFLILCGFYESIAQKSDSSQTDSNKRPITEEQRLPEIQLKEYTIVGLAKVNLPYKIRPRIFKDVKINWIGNQQILLKEIPVISFQFSRVKPTLLELYPFPWFNSKLYYGSFNTAGIHINSQFKIDKTLPYLSTDFERSDGHADNSHWTTAALQTGVHHQLAKGHLIHAGTNYRFDTRGIWQDTTKLPIDWETESILWDVFGSLNQKWSDKFHSRLNGTLYLDDHENAFLYSDRGLEGQAEINLKLNKTLISTQAIFKQSKVTIENGNLSHIQNDSISLKEYEASLFTGKFTIQQTWKMLTGKIGVVYQQTTEDFTTFNLMSMDTSRVNPFASVSFGFGGYGEIFAAYRPRLELHRIRTIVNLLPFSEVSGLGIIDYNSRIETGINIDLPKNFQVHASGAISTVKNYPAIVSRSNSLNTSLTNGYYPGWVYGIYEKVEIVELKAKTTWKVLPRLWFTGWLNVTGSNIKSFSDNEKKVSGNELPYFPDLTGEASFGWNFYHRHEIILSTEFVGQRFDDSENSVMLDSYALFNARLNLALSNHFIFTVNGRNLLDTKYEEWLGFNAMGINGWIGLKIEI